MSNVSDLIAEDIGAYLKQHEHKSLLRFITCGSVDDGKSTLIGRLLYESKMLFEDQLAALEADSKKVGTQGGDLDFALLVDGLSAEREQGITIDVAYRFFSTDRRKFIVADTPGHEQYTRNMVTGASTADLATRWLVLALLVVYTLYNVGPIFWLLLSSFKSRMDFFTMPPKLFFTPDLSGYQAVFGVGAAKDSASAVGVFDSLVNSVIVSVAGTSLAVFFGTLAGYVCSRFNFAGKGDFMFFVLSTRMLQPVAVLVFYHLMFARLGLADTRFGLVLVSIFANVGLATWIMKGFFDGVPREVEQIAIVNGYSRMYAFIKLVLPMVKGGIAATAGFCFIFAWNEFAFSSILTTTQAKTLPVRVSSAMGATGIEWTQICAAGVVLVLPVAIFFYLIRKHLLMGMTFGVLGRR